MKVKYMYMTKFACYLLYRTRTIFKTTMKHQQLFFNLQRNKQLKSPKQPTLLCCKEPLKSLHTSVCTPIWNCTNEPLSLFTKSRY